MLAVCGMKGGWLRLLTGKELLRLDIALWGGKGPRTASGPSRLVWRLVWRANELATPPLTEGGKNACLTEIAFLKLYMCPAMKSVGREKWSL